MKKPKAVSLPAARKRPIAGGSRDASLRLEVIRMITIAGTAYTLCGHCLNWFQVEQLGWDNELLTWVCYPSCDTR